MKLTHEGAARLGRHEAQGFPVCDFEFQPEDFKGGCCQNGKDHIVLTVEEAKEFLIAFQDLIELHEDGYIKITDFGFDTFDLVKKRIEQAEKGDVENSR